MEHSPMRRLFPGPFVTRTIAYAVAVMSTRIRLIRILYSLDSSLIERWPEARPGICGPYQTIKSNATASEKSSEESFHLLDQNLALLMTVIADYTPKKTIKTAATTTTRRKPRCRL